MRNNLDDNVTNSYRMNTQLDIYRMKPILYASRKYNSNSLAAVVHMNKSNAASNSRRVLGIEESRSGVLLLGYWDPLFVYYIAPP